MDVLYLSPQDSATASALAKSAEARGMQVVRYRSAGVVVDVRSHAYGGPRFMQRLADHVEITTLEPTDSWLPSLPWSLRRRDIQLTTLGDARAVPGRAFVKTPREKDFEAGVYTLSDLPHGHDDVPVLVSEIVTFTHEYRLFVLDGEVRTASRYLTGGRLDSRPLDRDPARAEVLGFAHTLMTTAAETLPSAVTVDVGWAVSADRGDEGWAVVEANMAWFSNCYDCDPDRALDVVLRSAGPSDAVSARDKPFITAGRNTR